MDFVANQGSRRTYVQSAFVLPAAARRDQELRPYVRVNDSFKKIVVIGGSSAASRDERGIVAMGIKQFLLDAHSLEA